MTWIIEHGRVVFPRAKQEDPANWDIVLAGGDVDEGRWRGAHQAEIYMAWLRQGWGRWRVFRLRRLPGPVRE